jgi:hypothetical protein
MFLVPIPGRARMVRQATPLPRPVAACSSVQQVPMEVLPHPVPVR